MEFQYCPDCGKKLIKKEIGDEGMVPYCDQCGKPLFDMFSTCIIVLVVNKDGNAALLRQNYISSQYYNLVSGYMKPGETAEETAYREVKEELGITVSSLRIIETYWFAKKDMLMIGFFADTDQTEFSLSREVDGAHWIPVKEAIRMVHPKGSISYALVEKYLNEIK